jgi:WD40 repeat protein
VSRDDSDAHDERLAERTAELADRITRGEEPDLADLRSGEPGLAEALRPRLETIRWLSGLVGREGSSGPARPPQILGDFRLGAEVGRGGIGVVYEARQISLGRRVAVKVLPAASFADPKQLRRFELEAQAAAALQHPNIVPVIAYGNEGGVPYFAMRLIDGRSLAHVIQGLRERGARGLPPREAAGLIRQAAEALDYAHRNEIYHRDIKPSNLLVDDARHLWVVDFGLARVRGDSDLTATGDVVGTLRYLSPEQARGRRGAIDARSEVYALGATLYELLTLRTVFDGGDRVELLRRVLNEEPLAPRKLDRSIPLDLETIVLKALAKDPAERYVTAGELAEDLGRFLADRAVRARRPTLTGRGLKWARQHGKSLAAAGLFAVLTLIGLAGAGWWSNARLRKINQRLEAEIDRADRNERDAREQAARARRHSLGAQLRLASQAFESGHAERAQEILRDIPLNAGSGVPESFVWRYLWRQSRREVVVLVGPTVKMRGMGLSPDGKTLATTRDHAGLQLRDVESGSLRREIDPGPRLPMEPVFSPDGSRVAAPCRGLDGVPDDFRVWEVDTGRLLTSLPATSHDAQLSCAFIPGGEFLGYEVGRPSDPPDLIRWWDLKTDPSRPRLIAQIDQFLDLDASLPGGILTQESPRSLVLRDPHTGTPARRFELGLPGAHLGGSACSVGGKFVAAATQLPCELRVWDGRSGKLLATHAAPTALERLLFSPDGAVVAGTDSQGNAYLIDRVTGKARPIRPEGSDRSRHLKVRFSPDSTKFAVGVFVPGSGIGSVSVWETASGRRLANFPGRPDQVGRPDFTPDSRSLLVFSRTGVRRWRLPSEGGDHEDDPQPAGHKDEAWSLAFSRDGVILATGSDDTKSDPTIKFWDTATARLVRAWGGGEGTVSALAFSPDNRTLVSGHLVDQDNVRVWDVATGRRLAVLAGHTDRVRALAYAPDGAMVATASSDRTVRLWDAATWREWGTLRGHASAAHAVAFSASGRTLASAGDDGDVRLWNLGPTAPDAVPRVLHGRNNLMAVAFAPDGKTLVAADSLGSMTVWDLERLVPVRSIHGESDDGIRQLAFTLDGVSVASAGIKGEIRLWDPETGQEQLRLSGHARQINGLAFSPDGAMMGSVAHDGSVRLWRAR